MPLSITTNNATQSVTLHKHGNRKSVSAVWPNVPNVLTKKSVQIELWDSAAKAEYYHTKRMMGKDANKRKLPVAAIAIIVLAIAAVFILSSSAVLRSIVCALCAIVAGAIFYISTRFYKPKVKGAGQPSLIAKLFETHHAQADVLASAYLISSTDKEKKFHEEEILSIIKEWEGKKKG